MNIYTEPVAGDRFFARDDILKSLLKSAQDIKSGYRHNIAITGRGLIGKSSLLLHFLGIIKEYEGLIPVYINLKGLSFREFVNNYMSALLYQGLKKAKRLKEAYDIDYLKDSAKPIFPKTCDLICRIEDLIAADEYDEAYSAMWDLNVVLTSESGGSPVIVWDEFNLITSYGIKRPFQILGQKIMVQQKTLFILSSSNAPKAKKILNEKLSLLFGGFKHIDIGPFSLPQSRDFIDSQSAGLKITEDVKEFLLSFTGGHPFYLSSVIQKLHFLKLYGASKIGSRQLGQVIAELLFYPGGIINQFFTDQLKYICCEVPDIDIYDLLKVILTSGRSSEIMKKTTISSMQLLGLLNRLLELGLASSSGSMYAITDPVFRMWVEIKLKPRNKCFNFIPSEEVTDYTKEVDEKLAEFKAARKKDLDKMVTDLLSSFKNDKFFIDERIRVLPRLEFVRQRKFGPDASMIVMRNKKDWLFLITNRRVTEDYIYTVSDKIRSLRCSFAKAIIIAASDVDDSAKIIAKQKKFWVWGRDDINSLFQFYKGYSAVVA